jgi:signal transduction histidine kinase
VESLILWLDALSALLSTIQSLAHDERAAAERELVPPARSLALGELSADIAHDVANHLFGVIGLADLLLEHAAAGSETEARLQLLQRTALELKDTLRLLLAFARPPGDEPEQAALDAAARTAVALVRHGAGRMLTIDERYSDEPSLVPCPPAALVQTILHLLLAARSAGAINLDVTSGRIGVSPVPLDSLHTVIAQRIATDAGARVERDGDRLALAWT